jgi:hypothetical protein
MAGERSPFSEVPPKTDCQPEVGLAVRWCRARIQTVGSQLMGLSRVAAFPLVGFGADVVWGSSRRLAN